MSWDLNKGSIPYIIIIINYYIIVLYQRVSFMCDGNLLLVSGNKKKCIGYDFRNDTAVYRAATGHYSAVRMFNIHEV